MLYAVDTTHAQSTSPVVAAHLSTLRPNLAGALTRLKAWQEEGTLPYLNLPFETADLDAIAPIADAFRRFEAVIVLGTGGSSLGGKTLYSLVDKGFGPPAGTPTMYFLDNVDPTTFTALTQTISASRLGLVVISKSGNTAETLTQFLTLIPFLQKAAPQTWQQQVVVITEPGTGVLRTLADAHGLRTLEHDPKVGGRFSVLSVVGMLPALIAGIDAHAVRRGAKTVMEPVLAGDTAHPAVEGALWNIAFAKAGYTQTVLMPYSDQLADFGLWYRQLWAESLGKNGHGTTPIRAMGTVDQHSQLQLYLDGPKDKIFTVLVKEAQGKGDVVSPALATDTRLSYLAGRRMGDLLVAEQQAVIQTLANKKCPVRVIRLQNVEAETLGALFMHYMVETIVAAHLLGVDAFDQPAVEEGKILTRTYLSSMPLLST
jgi:glucose-6-phosphate isomerase